MSKYKFHIDLPPQVVYEVEADSLEQARAEAQRRAYEDNWLKVKPPCPVLHKTDEVALLPHDHKLLRGLTGLVQASERMDAQKRYSIKRCKQLKELQEKATRYQELLMEMQTSLKQHRLELGREVRDVGAMQPK